MSSADLELQAAVVSRLRAFTVLTNIVGQKVYDRPPATAVEPYVTLEDTNTLRTDVTCLRAGEIFLNVHAWSTYTGGFMEVKQMADAVASALHEYPLTLATNRLVSISHRTTRTFRDPDGITSHSVIGFVAYVEEKP